MLMIVKARYLSLSFTTKLKCNLGKSSFGHKIPIKIPASLDIRGLQRVSVFVAFRAQIEISGTNRLLWNSIT